MTLSLGSLPGVEKGRPNDVWRDFISHNRTGGTSHAFLYVIPTRAETILISVRTTSFTVEDIDALMNTSDHIAVQLKDGSDCDIVDQNPEKTKDDRGTIVLRKVGKLDIASSTVKNNEVLVNTSDRIEILFPAKDKDKCWTIALQGGGSLDVTSFTGQDIDVLVNTSYRIADQLKVGSD